MILELETGTRCWMLTRLELPWTRRASPRSSCSSWWVKLPATFLLLSSLRLLSTATINNHHHHHNNNNNNNSRWRMEEECQHQLRSLCINSSVLPLLLLLVVDHLLQPGTRWTASSTTPPSLSTPRCDSSLLVIVKILFVQENIEEFLDQQAEVLSNGVKGWVTSKSCRHSDKQMDICCSFKGASISANVHLSFRHKCVNVFSWFLKC